MVSSLNHLSPRLVFLEEKAIVPLDGNPEDAPGILVGDFLHSPAEDILTLFRNESI